MRQIYIRLLFLLAILLPMAGCNDDTRLNVPDVPKVTLGDITSVIHDDNSVSLEVSVESHGVSFGVGYGFVYGTDENPKVLNLNISGIYENGKMVGKLPPLEVDVTYYVRAYFEVETDRYVYSEPVRIVIPNRKPQANFSAMKATAQEDESYILEADLSVHNIPEGAVFGFRYATKETFDQASTSVEAAVKDGKMTVKLPVLKDGFTYIYQPYCDLGHSTFLYGEKASFSIPEKPDPNKILVAGGTFMMGNPITEDGYYDDAQVNIDEAPQHQVTLKSFNMGKYEVTNEEFCAFLNDMLKKGTAPINLRSDVEILQWIAVGSLGAGDRCPIKYDGEKYVLNQGVEKHPVAFVRYAGAEAYAKWSGGRLPTEAEWEYAALGGDKAGSKASHFAGSNDINEVAWFDRNSQGSSHPVGTKKANQLGLYDMSGNVGEWCQDDYMGESKGYQGAPNDGSAWKGEGARGRIIRGGSFQSSRWDCRSKYRTYNSPRAYYGPNVGFRVVWDVRQ